MLKRYIMNWLRWWGQGLNAPPGLQMKARVRDA